MLEKLLETVKDFDTICIYRHVNPDGDANGSQFGLKTYLENQFPEKTFYALGKENVKTFFPQCYHGDIDFSKALAIVCDTANRERIDGEGVFDCAKIIKIDHHPIVDNFGDINIVNEKACATCEVLGTLLMENNEKLTQECATYLYCGLLTDSQKFGIRSVTPNTFKLAGYLASFGVDIPLVNERMFASDLNSFRYETYLRSHVEFIHDSIAYVIADRKDYEQFGLTFEKAKEKVFIMNSVEEFQMYCLFTQQSDGTYSGSLRSKNAKINDIAANYHGGGHNLACGVRGLTRVSIQSLLNDLYQRLKEAE